jgi:chemotaxis protein methyltransferase CheR
VGNVLALEDDSEWDIIFFRNVAIYLEREYGTRVWEGLLARLTPEGFLVTGKAERAPEAVGMHRFSPSIYQKLN